MNSSELIQEIKVVVNNYYNWTIGITTRPNSRREEHGNPPRWRIWQADGAKARFVSHDAIDYNTGAKGIFFIENDRGLWIDGFTSFCEIKDGKYTIETELDRKYDRNSIELLDARELLN